MNQIEVFTKDEEIEFDDTGSYNHSLVQGNLGYLLRQSGQYSAFIELSLDTSPLDREKFAGIPNELIPDICLYPRRSTLPTDLLRVTDMPLLAIEVISPRQGTLGLIEKFKANFALGIQSCWLVDPALNVVAVYSSPETHQIYADKVVVDKTLSIEISLTEIFT